MELAKTDREAMEQFNEFLGNMFKFEEEDMVQYDSCYKNVFSRGINFSFMSLVFYAQFSAEILLGLLASNGFRKYLIEKLDKEPHRLDAEMVYWNESMETKRYGIPGHDYTADTADLKAMADDTYVKIKALNEWFGTEDGRKEFDMYCLSKKAVRDIKRIVCEFPYLIRCFDYDAAFAADIMEYAGTVANQLGRA